MAPSIDLKTDGAALRRSDVVVLEEHYADPKLSELIGQKIAGPLAGHLLAGVEERVARLDRLGIATEVLALAPPGLQAVTSTDAAEVAREVNDSLAAYVGQARGRLAAFAALPTIDPQGAARELARCVETHGFVGAMIHGPTKGRFMDDPAFGPVFATAAALGVPLYLHPSEIMAPVREAYFDPFAATHPMFVRAGWGYTIETGTHALRLALGGVFDRHPDLRLILGHLGEGIPYLLERIDEALARDTPMKRFREVFTRHVHVTTSGFFSTPALRCCIEELGLERVMFSIDAPYASSEKGMAWLDGLDLGMGVMQGVAGANARRLLKL